MSGGPACACAESKKPVDDRNWEVIEHSCNYSSFNGGHRTPSDYSGIRCKSCGRYWRTKANYVDDLVVAGKKAR